MSKGRCAPSSPPQRCACCATRPPGSSLLYRNLLSSVVSNAQLAALEITDGVDLSRMPLMLDSVQNSVTRSAELLEHLIWHASRAADDEDGSGT